MFRIDLARTQTVNIFLVVIRDQININFQPISADNIQAAYRVRAEFIQLQKDFTLSYRRSYVRGGDSEHVKRHHGIFMETEHPHRHISFDRDVTPSMLKEFLHELVTAQNGTQFVDLHIAKEVLNAFTEYYKEFEGSSRQRQFLDERRLDKFESQRLAECASKELGALSQRDSQEIESHGIPIKPISEKFNSIADIDLEALRELVLICQSLKRNYDHDELSHYVPDPISLKLL